MACFENIICLGEFCSCGEEIDLINLLSPVTGIIHMHSEFNGIKLVRSVEVSAGAPIEIPNIFNENYTHIIAFYDDAGNLINNTSYSIKTVICEGYVPIVDEPEYDHEDYDSTQYN